MPAGRFTPQPGGAPAPPPPPAGGTSGLVGQKHPKAPVGGSGVPGSGPRTATGTAPAAGTIDVTGVQAWADQLYLFYLGRPATLADLQVIAAQGWTHDQLRQHLRAQPSYIPGLSMGGYEDLYNVSRTEFLKYLGHEPGDQDIRELVQKGIADQFSVNSYLKNRADVVALHPGAPIDLTDEEYGAYKQPVQAHYQQNLQRAATDEEVRQSFLTRNSPAPARETALEPSFQLNPDTKALQAPNLLSPTARAYA
jgi:hypothetical protein